MEENKRTIDHVEWDICETQAVVFEKAAAEGYDMEQFISTYMSSDFCRCSMDTTYSPYQLDAAATFELALQEIGNVLSRYPDDMMYNPDAAWWIGFAYRMLYIETGIPSAELVEKVPIGSMNAVYPAYHTIYEEMATDRLCEDHGLTKLPPKKDPLMTPEEAAELEQKLNEW